MSPLLKPLPVNRRVGVRRQDTSLFQDRFLAACQGITPDKPIITSMFLCLLDRLDDLLLKSVALPCGFDEV